MKIEAGIFRSASILINEIYPVLLRYLVEIWLVMSCSKAFCELLPSRGKAVEGFVARCPESIPSCIFRRRNDLQNGIVGWDALERDAGKTVSVPTLVITRRKTRTYSACHP